jgi:hypothetical protein
MVCSLEKSLQNELYIEKHLISPIVDLSKYDEAQIYSKLVSASIGKFYKLESICALIN